MAPPPTLRDGTIVAPVRQRGRGSVTLGSMNASPDTVPRSPAAQAAEPIFIPWPANGRAHRARGPSGRDAAAGSGLIDGRAEAGGSPGRAGTLRHAARLIREATGHVCVTDYLRPGGRFALIASRVPEELAAFLRARPETAPDLFSFAAEGDRWTFWRVAEGPDDPAAREPQDAPATLSSRTLRIQLTELDALPL